MRKLILMLFLNCLILACVSDRDQQVPKTLLFSPITPEYLKDTAAKWANDGFDGFLLSGIMSNWDDDIWAADGDSQTRGENDLVFKKVAECNAVCADYGITDNFIKIAFYNHVPFWLDNKAWQVYNERFREAARFAKMSGCRGVALDIEYVAEQYDLAWEGYDYQGYSVEQLRSAARQRMKDMMRVMLKEYPTMIFLTLPEGIEYYGPLASDLFAGMVAGMAEANAPEGMFLLTEKSYSMVNVMGLLYHTVALEKKIEQILSDNNMEYWKTHCGIALGGWPLGYYREIYDDQGKMIGYSGKKEKFGDKVVGSYRDKSARFSVEEFKTQYAGLLMGSKKYCWIYGHGATWWQLSADEANNYGSMNNATLPVDERLTDYQAVVRDKWLANDPVLKEMTRLLAVRDFEAITKMMGFIEKFYVVGPFDSQGGSGFDRQYAPENDVDVGTIYAGFKGQVKWKVCSANATGYLDFLNYLAPTEWVCAYALVYAESPTEIDAEIRFGSNDAGALWVNQEKVLSKNVERSAVPDDDVVPVVLRKGKNEILVKVCNTEINWGLFLRITDKNGEPLTDLKYIP